MTAPPIPVESALKSLQDASSPSIVFEQVSIAFERKPVLDGISFQLAKGETKAILGVAGSGKSTILKLSLGLLKPDDGHIYVLGEDVTELSEEALFDLRRKIGMVFQESALFDSLTVRENVAFRRNAPARGHCTGNRHTTGNYPLRLTYWRLGPGYFEHYHRASRETAGCVQDQFASCHSPAARCLHH